jgi:hypothetical protein
MFTMIVIALNDLPESQHALRTAIDQARTCNAEIATVSILGNPPAHISFSVAVDPGAPAAIVEERENRHKEMHEKATNLARELGVHAQGPVVVGNEVRAILHFSKSRTPIYLSLGCINTTFICPVFETSSTTSLRTLPAAYSECTE